MTKLAIISDIHGNVDALKAVLADIECENVDNILNLGDHFSGPLAAAETADILMAQNFPSIRGNHERFLLETRISEMGQSDLVAMNELPAKALDWIKAQPLTLQYSADVFMCHGTPDSDMDYLLERILPDGNLGLNAISEITKLTANITCPVILCGHTHQPRIVHNGEQLIVNPGSVGVPAYQDDEPVLHISETGSPHARYAIIEKRSGIWQARLHAVPYDPTRMIALAQKNNRSIWVNALRTGRTNI